MTLRSSALLTVLAAVLAMGAATQKNDGLTLPKALAGYRSWDQLLEKPRPVSAQLWSLCRPPTLVEQDRARQKGGPHALRAVMVYATPDVAKALSSNVRSFASGAVLAKEKLAQGEMPDGVAFMIKHGGREFSASGGWEFRYYPTVGDPRKTHQHCAECHQNGVSRDYVLGEYPAP